MSSLSSPEWAWAPPPIVAAPLRVRVSRLVEDVTEGNTHAFTLPCKVGVAASPQTRPDAVRPLREGFLAGCLGAATIAVWFFLLDVLVSRPLYTPSLLGTALFGASSLPADLDTLPVSLEMVIAFTCVHGTIFIALGWSISWLLSLAERQPLVGFGLLMLMLFILFNFGFVVSALFFRTVLLHAFAWGSVLLGNLLAALAMSGYLWYRYRPRMLHGISKTWMDRSGIES